MGLQLPEARPCIAGTRGLVSVILNNLAQGIAPETSYRAHPADTRDGIQAAIAYAAEAAREGVVLLARPDGA